MSTEYDYDNPLERDIERYFTNKAKAADWLVFKFSSPQVRGVPDRLAILPGGETVYIEVKRRTGKTTKLQDLMIGRIRKQGARVYVIHSKEQADTLIAVLETPEESDDEWWDREEDAPA